MLRTVWKKGAGPYLQGVRNSAYRKPYHVIMREALAYARRERDGVSYFTHMLFEGDSPRHEHFVGLPTITRIIRGMFYPNGTRSPLLEDKSLFGRKLEEAGIPGCKTLAVLRAGDVCYRPEREHLGGGLKDVLARLLDESSGAAIFIKPVDGMGGKDSYRIHAQELGRYATDPVLCEKLSAGQWIVQDVIKQHCDVSRMYSDAINTVRVHTYREPSGAVSIPSALMRFGARGSKVDNGSSGGLFAPIDLDQWVLRGDARTYLNRGGERFRVHPDSGVAFDGWSIPYGRQIEDFAAAAAMLFENEFVGWDIALTPSGPLLLEGNECPHLVMAQIACGGFRAHPTYARIFSDFMPDSGT